MGPKSLRTVSTARMPRPAPLASGDARPSALAVSLLFLLLLNSVVLAACTGGETSRLVITQSTDAPTGPDHKGHLSPGVFTGITLSIRNTPPRPPRPVPLATSLPPPLH